MTISPHDGPLGARKPRICNYPRYGPSAGQEAVELAASAGLTLDPWQADILTHALGEREDGRWSSFEVAINVPRQNGKGVILEARELAGLFLFNEQLILHSAHEMKTANEAFRRLERLIEGNDELRRRVAKVPRSKGEEGFELKNGNRLRFVARSTGSGRGFSGDCVILDEAYALSADECAALLPTLSARPNPQVWYTSSAGHTTSSHLLALRKRGHAGSPRLAYFEWSPEDGANLDDRRVWAGTNPALGIRITEEFIELERSALSDEGFGRERLGIWPVSTAEVVLDLDLWNKLADPNPESADSRVVLGIDVTRDRSMTSVAVAAMRTDGNLHVELIEHRRGTSWVGSQVEKLVETLRPSAVVIDGPSPASTLIHGLQAAGINVVTTNTREYGQACGVFYDLVSEKKLRHLDQAPLNAAIAGATKRPLGDSWAWNRKNQSIDISPLVAVTLAAWGYSTSAPGDDGDYDILQSLY